MTTSLRELNLADQDSFTGALGHIFEQSPWIPAQAWYTRPFADTEELLQGMLDVMWGAPAAAQIALIEAHPDLAGKAAMAGELTADSTREQSTAGLDRLNADEFAAFTRLNAAYRDRFGFPFIICVRENTRAGILAAFEERLMHSREQEIQTALAEIGRIARLRLLDTVTE